MAIVSEKAGGPADIPLSSNRRVSLDGFEITPSDTAYLPKPVRQIHVGGAGDVTLINRHGQSMTIACVAGQQIVQWTRRVMATGTTATDLVGYV